MTRRYPIDSSTDKPCWQYADGSLFCNDGVSCCRDLLLSTHVTDYTMSRMFNSTFTCGEIISELLNIWWIHTISNLVPQLPLLSKRRRFSSTLFLSVSAKKVLFRIDDNALSPHTCQCPQPCSTPCANTGSLLYEHM